jgi:multiple sugar transport system ATP-binding protein
MAEVRFKNINKVFNADITAVSDLNLEIKDKEFVVLLGPSGCGKSTSLRMLAGLETPTSGDVFVGDKNVTNMPAKDRDIAMVFQNYALYPHMDIYNNLAFALKLRRYSRAEIKKRVNESAEILGINHLLDRKPKEISGGERQRVAVGRAIVRKPQAFLFDEPLSNLDAKLRVQMRTEIKKLHIRIKSTMIYVTHDQTEAMTLGDRVAIMKKGKLLQVDTPLDVYDKPGNRFVAGFIGSPPMNFVEGFLKKKDNALFFCEKDGFQIKVPEQMHKKVESYIDQDITLGIRPENLYDKLFASYATADNTINVTCDVIETMGSQNHLYLATKNHTIIAVVDASNKPAVGSRVEIVFDTKKIHFFDPSTEDTIV